jgi:hypothetical protein
MPPDKEISITLSEDQWQYIIDRLATLEPLEHGRLSAVGNKILRQLREQMRVAYGHADVLETLPPAKEPDAQPIDPKRDG